MVGAINTSPSVTQGRTICLRLVIGSSKNGKYPTAGSQRSWTEKTKMSMMPSQKLGTDMPIVPIAVTM